MQEALDELYRTTPDTFVARRTELAKELVAAGDKPGAKVVKAARRPTVAAWAVNQLRDVAPELVQEALSVAAAGRRVLSGEEAGDARAIAAQRRDVVGSLLREAEGVLREAGADVSAAIERQIVETLDAALVSPEVAEQLVSGRLLAATTATGFEGLIVADPFGAGPVGGGTRPKLEVIEGGRGSKAKGSRRAAGDEDAGGADEEAEAAALLEQRRAETAAAAEKAQARVDELEVERDEAAAAVAALTDEVTDAEQAVADAEQALLDARAAAKDGEHRLAEVQERLDAAEQAAADAADAAARAAARS